MSDTTKKPPVEVEVNETDVLSNQTTFFDQELMEQVPTTLPVEVDPDFAEKEIARKKKQRVLILGGTVSVAVFLVLIAVVVLIMPVAQRQIVVTPSPIAFGQTAPETALSKRIDEVEQDLKAADPIKFDVSFPPINLVTLYLDAPPQ